MQKKVLVLGAGISGLAAAWKLSEAGFLVEVFDSADTVGGMASSFVHNGAIFDMGTHGLHASKQENELIIDQIRTLLGNELIRVTRKASIYFRKKRFNYPLTAKEIFFGLNLVTSISCLFDFIKARIKYRLKLSKKDEGNFETWMRNRFGDKLYNIYFGPYTERIWGFSPRLLSSDWATARIPVISLWDTIVKAVLKPISEKSSELHTHSPYRKYFYYTHQGSGRIPERIAEDILKVGGKIHLNSAVRQVKRDGSYIKEIITKGVLKP